MTQAHDRGRRILLGQIIAAHGIRGEVIVKSFTGEAADIASYGALTDAAGRAPLALSVVRVGDKGVVARIEGIRDRNGAEALRGRELFVLRENLPDTEEGAYYHADLVGLEAFSRDGIRIGRVVGVQNFGAGDLLEVARDGAKETELIPFTDACVPDIDVKRGRLTILPPEMSGDPEPHDAGDDFGGMPDGDNGEDAL
jgi:16S rRNA processing protein RimM